MAKKIIGFIKLQIPAGKANPSPPVGPALGQRGLNIMEFCKAFNEATKIYEKGTPTRVQITAFSDKTFVFEIKGFPISYLINKAIGLSKGSSMPGRVSAGSISLEQIRTIAEEKMKQGLSARDISQAMKIVQGSARSMGLKITKEAQNG